MAFAHLHCHTEYSLLDGATHIYDMVKRAADLDMPAVAITDHGVMSGVPELDEACRKVKNETGKWVKPIFGCEIYFTTDSELKKQKQKLHHMILLAKNNTGYHNLLKLVSESHVDNFYYRPRTTFEMLQKYSEGIIATSACIAGIIPRCIDDGAFAEAKEWAQKFAALYEPGDFYIELQDQGITTNAGMSQYEMNCKLTQLARELGLQTIATNDFHYLTQEDAMAQDIMLCIGTNATVTQEKRFKFPNDQFYMKTEEEMRQALKDFPEACDNTVLLAEKCNVELERDEILPRFPLPEGYTEEMLFREEIEKGLEHRYGPDWRNVVIADNTGKEKSVLEQYEYEADIIIQQGFPAYFLIVQEYIRWARENGIGVGPGRGSAAGSLCTYAMGITDLDPIKNGLMFERFLNPERVEMPDIDVDFDDQHRQDVIEHIREFYGEDHVAGVITFGKLQAKNAVRDAARVLDYPYAVGDRICKLIGGELGITINGALETNPDLKKAYDTEEDVKRVIDAAKSIEGHVRGEGVHACATIICRDPMSDHVPMKRDTKGGGIITQYDGHYTPDLGLLKMDFLGLSNLTIIHDTLKNIEANGKPAIDYTKIPLDDAETYKLMSRGDTLGVFQLDSDGMRSLLKTLKPNNFNDISALIALYRPGPMSMDSHTNYAKRKNGLQKITPIHPELEEPLKQVLDETYGLIIYQEQVQSAARILAGYSLGKADVLRRAMGKKKPEVLAKEKVPFFAGMKEHGYSEEASQAVWDILVPFSGYAFNKAHSAAYGLISYWTAYLKTHYPVEFMAALLQGAATNKDKTALYLGEARRMGIQVLSPDVNESVYEYSAVGDVVRFGLGAIRNVGDKAVADIIAEREGPRGKFVNFMDFIRRVPLTALNRRLVESLIKAGAFDSIDPNRRALLTVHEAAIDSVVSLKRKQAEGQFDLFSDAEDGGAEAMGDASVTVPDLEEWDKKTKLNFEREMLGLYVSDHPLSGMQSILASLREMSIAHLVDRAKTMGEGQQVTLAGLVTNVDRRVSKKGNPWAIVTIEDMESSIQCMFFGKVYEAAAAELAVDAIVQIRGQVELRDETVSLRATEMQIPTLEAEDERPLVITLPPVALERQRMMQLGQVLANHPGYCEVHLAVLDEKGNAQVLTFGDRFRVKRDTSLFAEIKILFGPSCLPAA